MKDLSIVSPAAAGSLSVAPASLTDLNTVTQAAFASITSSVQRAKITLRCDELPQVYATESPMLRLFQLISQMILDCSTPDSLLFIYIKSRLADSDEVDFGADKQQVIVSICSNAGNCDEWKRQHLKTLDECSSICTQENGSFACLPPAQTGVLFSITLPGKLNTHSLG